MLFCFDVSLNFLYNHGTKLNQLKYPNVVDKHQPIIERFTISKSLGDNRKMFKNKVIGIIIIIDTMPIGAVHNFSAITAIKPNLVSPHAQLTENVIRNNKHPNK